MEPLPSHLLVDGWNVLHAWPELRGLMRRDRAAARARLVQILTAVHDVEARRVTIVFDGRGPDLAIERPSAEASFSVLTTPAGTTADDVIEQLVANSDASACVVATADRAMRETVEAAGATVIGSRELMAWVERAEGASGRAIRRLRARGQDLRRP